jgi:tetratricopeptide (TPR) repeat protein
MHETHENARRRIWLLALLVITVLGVVGVYVATRNSTRPTTATGPVAADSERDETSRKPATELDRSPERAADTLPTAEQRMQAWREEAVATAKAAIQDLPDPPEPYGLLALAYGRFGQNAEAEEAWNACLERDARFADAHHGLGTIAMQRGDYESAVEHLRRALESKPNLENARTDLGDALMHSGRMEEAAAVFQEAVERSPSEASSYFRLGQVQHRLGDHQAAKESFENALQLTQDASHIYYGLSKVQRSLGEVEAAAETLKRFRELKTQEQAAEKKRLAEFDDEQHVRRGTAFIHLGAGTVYARNGRPEEAEREWLRAAHLDPDDTRVRSLLAEAYQQLNRLEEAADMRRELRDLEPENLGFCLQLGALEAERGRFEAADELFREAMEDHPENAAGYLARAQLHLQAGRDAGPARQWLQEAVRLDPRGSSYYLLAMACTYCGDIPAGIAALERACQLEPGQEDWRATLEQLRRQQGP